MTNQELLEHQRQEWERKFDNVLKPKRTKCMLRKVNGTKHLEATGEIYEENAFNEYFDEITVAIAKQTKMDELSYEEIIACRSVTQASMAISIGAGIGAGITFGNTVLGGIAIGVGTALVVDVVTPQKKLYQRVINNLKK